jgi:serine/threonine protein kinase/tetratricopeptide (TPR) repeat protein
MTEDRWQEVVALFERALEHTPEERVRFLDEISRTDPALRERVEAMLRADSAQHPLLDATSGQVGSVVGRTPAAKLEGTRIGPYEVVREVGRGGMATVYLAEDPRHNRSVAVKLLHVDASSLVGSDRFRREIEVLAQLQHPHILPLYDSGESNGRLYYVMPYVSGETLRDRIARVGPLPLDDVRRLTTDVAKALDYAHRHNIVHRDVKPANILVDDEHAMVADFGIAHLEPEGEETGQLTATGIVIGTPAYMSPEQAAGSRELDARSDIYSLGCVVYEMLAGEPPFRAPKAHQVLAKHMSEAAPSVRAARPSLPDPVDAVLRQAMAKAPEDRFASAREFMQALDEAIGDHVISSGSRARAVATPNAPARLWRWLGGIAAVLVVAVLGLFVLNRPTLDTASPPSIAVLPFVNMSADPTNEYFSDGLTEELTSALAQLGRIRVAPRTAAFAYKGRNLSIRQIGQELDVSRILEATVRRDGDRLTITARLYDTANDSLLWQNRYERDWGSVLALQNELAGAIADNLQMSLLPGERERLAQRHTVNAEAYDRYLEGRHFFDLRTAASLEQAEKNFKQALAIDSLYARAHAGLADTYSIRAWTGSAAPTELFALAQLSAERALALDSTLAEAHMSLGLIHTFYTWNWAAAERELDRAIALDSTLSQTWFFKTWGLVAQGRMDDALAALHRARQLEPLSLITNVRIGTVYSWMKRWDSADSALQRTLAIDPTYPVGQVQRARVLSARGQHAEAIEALPPDSVRLGSYESGIAGYVYAKAGRPGEARAAARALEARSYVPAEGVAAIYAGLGDLDAAFRWINRAIETRGVGLIFFAAESMYDTLRTDPRYPDVIKRIGLGTPR